MRAPVALAQAAVVALASAAVVLTSAPAADAATLAGRARAAVDSAQAQGMTAGIAVLDTTTGVLTLAGRAHHQFAAASVVKTLIAARLLLAGRMTGTVAEQAERMIRHSDNAAAYALYPKAGGARLVPWLARHYGITDLGTPALQPRLWGTTQLTAAGLARFYAAVRADPVVWPWLGTAMHHYAARSSTGEPNDWGLAAAAPRVALKNGWAQHPDARGRLHADINTTGLVQHDRYVVVVLAQAQPSYYYRLGEAIITRAAKLLLPGGRVVPPPS